MNRQKHVHFMGICGSGCASIAMLAIEYGYKVTGCDSGAESYYAGELKKMNIPIYIGHHVDHLENVDIVAVSPAIFDINPNNAELLAAKERGILMTWQEFMGSCLQKEKRVVGISGTHGKTTTTFLTADILINAGVDPTIMGGSVNKNWGNGGRAGKSDIFVCEADEFNRNFYHYKPEIAVINNAEMDHPECYKDYEDMIDAYCNFVSQSPNLKTFILNGDSAGAVDVLHRIDTKDRLKNVKIIAIVKDEKKDFSEVSVPVDQAVYQIKKKSLDGTEFDVIYQKKKHSFSMKMCGDYNVQNATTAIMIAWQFGVTDQDIMMSLPSFSGVGRRFDKVGNMREIPVYDDYAHHPTEISAVLTMCKDYFPDKKVVAVFEPHQVSRLRLMFQDYVDALCIADHVIVGRTHMGREIHKGIVPISKEEWEKASAKMKYEEDRDAIKQLINDKIDTKECDIIIVIGAANSYKLSRYLCQE